MTEASEQDQQSTGPEHEPLRRFQEMLATTRRQQATALEKLRAERAEQIKDFRAHLQTMTQAQHQMAKPVQTAGVDPTALRAQLQRMGKGKTTGPTSPLPAGQRLDMAAFLAALQEALQRGARQPAPPPDPPDPPEPPETPGEPERRGVEPM